jgi:hypothetical protein
MAAGNLLLTVSRPLHQPNGGNGLAADQLHDRGYVRQLGNPAGRPLAAVAAVLHQSPATGNNIEFAYFFIAATRHGP